jgi:hypothetical protein
MFSIALDPTFVHPVKGTLPGGVPVQFEATFKRLSVPERQELEKQSVGEFVREVLAGWKGITDEAGAPLEFGPQTVERLLAIEGVEMLIFSAFFEAITEIRRKN